MTDTRNIEINPVIETRIRRTRCMLNMALPENEIIEALVNDTCSKEEAFFALCAAKILESDRS